MKTIDLTTQSKTQLDNLINNRSRHGDLAGARNAALERIRRGQAKPIHMAYLEWTPERVQIALEPFVEISQSVVGSKRKAHVVAGGGRRKHRSHPDALWVDTYSGIKTTKVNATIACHIREVGDEPLFIIIENDEPLRFYSLAERDVALSVWEMIVVGAKLGAH